MVTGHFGFALMGKAARRRVPLWLLTLATFAPDLVKVGLFAFGIPDPTYVWSHSFQAALGLAVVLAGPYLWLTRDYRGAAVVILVTMSHLAADFLTGDKPFWPRGPRIGLDLYSHTHLELALELATVAVGAIIYWRAERRERPRRRWRYVTAMSVVVLVQVLFGGWLRSLMT